MLGKIQNFYYLQERIPLLFSIIWIKKNSILAWQAPNLHLPKEIPFWRYFVAKIPISKATEILTQEKLYYSIVIDIGNDKVQQIPEYNGASVAVATCVSCHKITCPDDHLPCKCGWTPHIMGPNPTDQSYELQFM